MSMPQTVKVVEDGHVSPPPGSVPTTSLPLTYLDITWLGFPAQRTVWFYEFPHPTSYFMQNTLPNLKASLSLTLQHFFPLAGKLLLPASPHILPYILYTQGDSVSFIVNESTANFSHLTGDHAPHVEELQALVPKSYWPWSMSPNGCMEKPLIAIQITVFPMAGISIGFASCHSAADGSTVSHFIKSWASAHSDHLTCNKCLPNFNRDLIKDPSGLASRFFKLKGPLLKKGLSWTRSTDKLHLTLSIKRSQVVLLKDSIAKLYAEEDGIISEPLRFSTFVVTCAYMWVCMIKFQDRLSPGADHGGALCHFSFSADCRELLNLPATYFGNCVALNFAAAKRNELTGEKGTFMAAKAIGRRVMEVNKEPLNGAENWLSKLDEIFKLGNSVVSVVGSPKMGFNKIDFGWGRPAKANLVSLRRDPYFFITDSREEEGGMEFGLALAPDELDTFNAIFLQGLS